MQALEQDEHGGHGGDDGGGEGGEGGARAVHAMYNFCKDVEKARSALVDGSEFMGSTYRMSFQICNEQGVGVSFSQTINTERARSLILSN